MSILVFNKNNVELHDFREDGVLKTDALVTFTVGQVAASGYVTDATAATPINIESVGHDRSTADKLILSRVMGVREANEVFDITKVDADNFTLDGSTGTGAFIDAADEVGRGKWFLTVENAVEVSMPYVAGSLASYVGVIPETAELAHNAKYVVLVRVSNYGCQWEISQQGAIRIQ